MKKHIETLFITAVIILMLGLYACGDGDRITGNEQAAHAGDQALTDTTMKNPDRPDTTVTGVPGNTNAVNSVGNAGNGSGMGSSSNTEAENKNKPE